MISGLSSQHATLVKPKALKSCGFISKVNNIYNSPRHCPLADIVRFGPLRIAISLTILKMRLLGRSFHTVIKNVLFPSPTNVGSHNPPSLGPAFSLAHCSESGSNTICNRPSPPIEDIVRFGPLHIIVSLTIFKCVY